MSLYNYWAAPEPKYSDDEWSYAKQLLVDERAELGWSETEIDAAVDDYLIAEKCDRLREDRDADWADAVNKRQREDA